MMMIAPPPEVWRTVVGSPDYEVSSRGNVKSLARLVARRFLDGRTGQRRVPERLLKLIPVVEKGRLRHVQATLHDREGGQRGRKVHQLVLEAFIGPRPPSLEGCHDDGDPANNWLDNLRWDTRTGNAQDAVRHGTAVAPFFFGEDHPRAKLTAVQVEEIKRTYDPRARNGAALARRFAVSEGCIRHVAHGRSRRQG